MFVNRGTRLQLHKEYAFSLVRTKRTPILKETLVVLSTARFAAL
jgi:hypothetical protein